MDGTASLICCVLDTNVLIHDLSKFMNFLPQLSDQIKIGGFGGYFFELVIPHVVLQELDALKMAVRCLFR
jgi:predicted ribonuclease YlaK